MSCTSSRSIRSRRSFAWSPGARQDFCPLDRSTAAGHSPVFVRYDTLHRANPRGVSDAVFLTDDDGRFTFISPNVDAIFGYSRDEVQAMTHISALLGEGLFDRAALSALGEVRNVCRETASKAGHRRILLIHIMKVSIGAAPSSIRASTSRSDGLRRGQLRAARLDLAHASRLALAGELVASIAHEINQPLTSIQSNASAGLRRLNDGPGPSSVTELREIFLDIRGQSRRAADVVARVRALADRRPVERQLLDVNEVAGGIVRLVGTEVRRRGVTVRTELAPSLPAIAGDRVCLEQVILNLVSNAMDAMEQLDEEERQLLVRTRRLDAAVEIAVSDVGHGIPPDRMDRLFDAFFTTKREGLGLGLAIVRTIVEAHDGRIWAEDHGGRGATFRMTLPVAATQ